VHAAAGESADPQVLLEKLNNRCDDIVSEIRGCLVEPLEMVQKFVGGTERDRWTMHFLKTVGTDLHIQKSEDYRVFDWTRRIDSGEWI
jgi:hypothetical protein